MSPVSPLTMKEEADVSPWIPVCPHSPPLHAHLFLHSVAVLSYDSGCTTSLVTPTAAYGPIPLMNPLFITFSGYASLPSPSTMSLGKEK